MCPEAKEVVKKAGLDKNRSKHLKVAAEETPEAQLARYRNSRRNLKRETNGVRPRQSSGLPRSPRELPLSAEHEEVLESLTRAFKEAPPNVQEEISSQ